MELGRKPRKVPAVPVSKTSCGLPYGRPQSKASTVYSCEPDSSLGAAKAPQPSSWASAIRHTVCGPDNSGPLPPSPRCPRPLGRRPCGLRSSTYGADRGARLAWREDSL